LFPHCFFACCPAAPRRRRRTSTSTSRGWLGYFNQTRLSDKFGFWLDVHARRIDWLERWNTLLIRPGADVLRQRPRAAHGGVRPGGALPGGGPRNHPARAPHLAAGTLDEPQQETQTQQWVRLEQRFNRKIANDQLQEGYNFNYRFRYLLALFVPLKGDFIQKGVPFVAFNNEVHINAGKQITYNYFDQNRFFLGLGYQFSKTVNAQLGYMNLFQQLPAGNRFNNNHVLRLFVFHNVDLRRKEAE
jgi:hypothetical protein